MVRVVILAWLCLICGRLNVVCQVTQPIVAVHDSELTRALESMTAVAPTPTGPGTTGKQWWPTDWHYFVMPESLKEAFRSDGTAFTVVGDSNVTSGILLTNGQPKYPIVVTLAAEALRDDEIAPLTNYVAAGGFLFVGSSAFTRATNGSPRLGFAFGSALGLQLNRPGLTNWAQNNTVTKIADHRLVAHIPSGNLTWRMPSGSDEIPWGISPSHPFLAPHDIWQVQATDATVLLQCDTGPFLTIKPYGKGYFIWCAAFQPLIGHGGFAPAMYSYMIFRRAVEWAFESSGLPIPKLSPWPYQYDAAYMVRHDLENYTNEVAAIEASAQVEFTNNAKGDYYFCTGTLRDDASSSYNTNTIVASLRRAVTNYGASIGPHNGGLKNPNNPSLVRGDYDYWHWSLDEAFDVSPPPSGYANGKAYAMASLSNAFSNIESWLAGTSNNSGLRNWCAPYFNSTREDSYDIQAQLNVKISGDQKIGFFPHWTLSTLTPNKRYSFLTEPVSDWFVVDTNSNQGLVAQSLEPWHPPGVQTSQTMHAGIDFYYTAGALINFYSHTLSTGLGPSGSLVPDYVAYCANTNLHPRMWAANAVGVYQWWLQRSNAQLQVTMTTNGNQYLLAAAISGATHTNTAVELQFPAVNSICSLQVTTNGVLASPSTYRTNAQTIKLQVGASITNVMISYYPMLVTTPAFVEAFDGVTAPALPSAWTTSASGAQSAWVTTNSISDSASNAAFSREAIAVGINELVSPAIVLPAGTSQISFRNRYDLEAASATAAFDGGVLELKIGTNAFDDILTAGGSFVTGGYNSLVAASSDNPLAGRQVWSGNSGGYVTTTANLPASASGKTVQFRWRCGTDTGGTGTGWRIDTVSMAGTACLCCGSPNTPPTLPVQTNRTIVESTPLVVTNTASDSDLPANTLAYALVNPPTGAAIDSAGVITWTPAENQGPSTNLLTTVVTDNGFPPMSATNSFTVIVTEVNSAPVLPAQTNRTIPELTILSVTNRATDIDVPANTLSYTLVNPPGGATISSSGVIIWQPAENQGPSTNLFTTIVTDNGSPPMSATNSFTVVVTEVNQPPTLPAQANRTITSSTFLQVTNTATDLDIPANTLTYALPIAPAGAVISAAGVITWTPFQNHTTNLFRTIVTDNGLPPLSATNNFTVIVNDDAVVVYNSSSFLVEGCSPTNNAIDAGETVSMLFGFQDTGLGNTTNLLVTLLATNGVLSPSAAQNYGALVAGGSAVSRPFTFSAGTNCGSVLTATFLLQDGSGALGTISVPLNVGQLTTFFSENFDSVTVPALPAGWTTFSGGAQANWRTTNSLSQSAPNAVFSADGANIGTNELISPVIILPAGPTQLSFSNFYNLETGVGTDGFDGGVLEIKIGTNAFTDIIVAGGTFVSGGYNSVIDTNWGNPLAGRAAWSGTNSGYISTVVNLPISAASKSIQLRWRCGTDNGNGGGGWRIDNVSIAGYACCANVPPVLPVQTNRTVLELSPLIVTNTAADDPANSLTYVLVAPPAGASIDTNGIITWTPGEAQGPGTNTITTVATDNGTPPLSATNSFTVIVTEVNSPPVLPVQTNQTIAELALLTVTNTASDSDLPANALSYILVNPPGGAAIDTNGVIKWTPSEAQGPSTNAITTVVTDNGVPPLSATNSFTVIVTEVNTAPVLPVQTNQTIAELTPLTVTNTASDSDLPANALSYVLVNPPGGATIDTNGVIKWTPSEAQGASTNTITTVVTDNGLPPLSATNSFTVIVTEVNSAPVLPVQTNQTVAELTLLTVTNTASDSDLPANALSYVLVNPPGGATIDTNGVIKWTPSEAQGPSTNTMTTVVTDNGVPPLSATNSFTVIVTEVNIAPVLPVQADRYLASGQTLVVTNTATDSDLPANGLTYSLLQAPSGATISSSGVITWVPPPAQSGQTTNRFTTVAIDDGFPPLAATNSFNAFVAAPPAAPSILSLSLNNQQAIVTWSSVSGAVYEVQYKTNVNDPAWEDILPVIQSTSDTSSATNGTDGASSRFYRVILVP